MASLPVGGWLASSRAPVPWLTTLGHCRSIPRRPGSWGGAARRGQRRRKGRWEEPGEDVPPGRTTFPRVQCGNKTGSRGADGALAAWDR